MKKMGFSYAAMMSLVLVLLGVIMLVWTGRLLYQYYFDYSSMETLTAENVKEHKYIKGEISQIVVTTDGNNRSKACFGEYGVYSKAYELYLAVLSDGTCTVLGVSTKEGKNAARTMENNEGFGSLYFTGSYSTNSFLPSAEWMRRVDGLTEEMFVDGFILLEGSVTGIQNCFIIGLCFLLLGIFLFFASGGLVTEVYTQRDKKEKKQILAGYSPEEREFKIRQRLAKYEDCQLVYRKRRLMGGIFLLAGFGLFFVPSFGVKLVGMGSCFWGSKIWWEYFIHSDLESAVALAAFLSIETLQDKKHAHLEALQELERNKGE